jgi:hypothetical protein
LLFFPAAMTLDSVIMADTYFNTQEPMKRIGQPDRIQLKKSVVLRVGFGIDGH